MNSLWKVYAATCALVAITTSSLADGLCAKPQETLALRAAAVQQELMVAALYCHDVGRYNRFVMAYRSDLQDADAALMKYFHRAGMGDAGYHAYKTRLANAFSMAGIRQGDKFCEGAGAVYDAALENPQALATLIFALPDARVTNRDDCEMREAEAPSGGLATASMGGSSLVRGH